jgi:hemerythrin-like domain-containing protein
MTPTELLMDEHRLIMAVLDAAEREADSIRATGKVHGDTVSKMVDFFRGFADRCHHAKEEKHLFRMMQDRGFPAHTGPLAVMLADHERGRAFVGEIDRLIPSAEKGDPESLTALAHALSEYRELLGSHIGKEDGVLYPMAEQLLTPNDWEELARIFERVEKEEIGEGVHETYHTLAHEIIHG